ncbi:cation diffusion facilitator family transporter [Actinomycetes bacterium KLBMP 9759]
MGSGHGHGTSASGRHMRGLSVALGVLAVFLVSEVVVGLATGSLSLLSDAAHMFTDVLGVAMALAAITAARRARRSDRRTFGLYRTEVLAALANAVLLFGVAGWVLYEAFRRITDPPEVPGLPLLLTAAAGLVANLVVFAILRRGAKESINVRGAYLEVVADTVGSVGVLLGGVVIMLTGWRYVDVLVAVAIGLFVLPRTWSLARQALRILVQAAPDHIDVDAVRSGLGELSGVRDVHDVHVWTLTSGMEVGSAHIAVDGTCDPAAILTAARELADAHGLPHFTVQVEPPAARPGCVALSW